MAKLEQIAPEVPVANLPAAIDYYKDRLGFQLTMQMPDGGYAIVERDNVSIHLFQDNARSCSPVSFHIFTGGLEEIHAEIQRRGAQISQEIMHKPWGTRDFRVNDDSGNELKFTERAG